MESHKCIFVCIWEFALDLFFVHICRNVVVDVKQRHCILADYGSDKLAQRSVNVYLAGYRNALCGQTAVHITRNKSELCLECRRAFSCDRNIFPRYPLCSSTQSFKVSSYCASFARISGFLFLHQVLLPSLSPLPGFFRLLHVC